MLGAVRQKDNAYALRRVAYAASFLRPTAATLVVGVPLSVLVWLSGAVPFIVTVAAVMLFVLVVMSAGFLLLRAAGAEDLPAPAAWVAGAAATMIAMYVLVTAFDVLAAWAFVLWAGLVLALSFFFGRHDTPPRRLSVMEAAPLLLCALATVFWCRELAEVPRMLARDEVLATWTDQFIHGSVISQFGDPRAAGRQTIELADFPRPFYHYATYMLPAAFASLLDLSGLVLATSVWVPLGFLTLCAGAYVLGATLAGPAGGVAGLAVLTIVPDAASYGLHNRLFGYYWYVLAVPGASYAVGVALLSIALFQRWLKTRELAVLVASAALVGALAMIRVHIFALALPAWLICVAIAAGTLRTRKLAACAGGLLGLCALVWAFYTLFPEVPHALELFLDVAHNQQSPVAYPGLYSKLMAVHGATVAVPAGVALVFAAFLGVFALLYPVSLLLVRRADGFGVAESVPLVFLAVYLLLMLTAPVPPHGDATEFTQRPFVLVYALVAVWTAATFAAWAARNGGLRQRRVWLPLLIAGCLAVMGVLRYTVRDWRWSYAYKVAEGLPRAAAFVRENSRPGDLLAAQGLHPGLVTTDLAVQVVSLTGVPAYLGRPFMHISNGGHRGEAALRRYTELRAVEREQKAATALERLSRLGIRWYVVAESDRRGPPWDPQRRQAVFVDRMVAVYSTRPAMK